MSSHVDTSNLDMLKEIIADDLPDILKSFIDISPTTVENIKTAIAENNPTDLTLHAHTLKGSSANIGALQLPALSLVLENKGKEGITEGLDADVAAIEEETKAVNAFLMTYLD